VKGHDEVKKAILFCTIASCLRLKQRMPILKYYPRVVYPDKENAQASKDFERDFISFVTRTVNKIKEEH